MFAQPVAMCAARALKAWGAATLQGRRPEQEDRYAVVTRLPGRQDLAFFGVYDGHGGSECARFAARHLHTEVGRSKHLGRGGGVRQALAEAFAAVEKGFIELADKEKLGSGTTALAAVLRFPDPSDARDAGELTVAHVGDSRAVLCRGGKALALTEDHKPEDKAERSRIEALGGFVTERAHCPRVQGVLAMSRALGNRLLKPIVSATPTVAAVPLQGDDAFFVLASDGLFDVFENQEVVDIVRQCDEPEQAAQTLAQRAFNVGSCDNITVVVVALRGHPAYAEMERGDSDTPEALPERKSLFGRVASWVGSGDGTERDQPDAADGPAEGARRDGDGQVLQGWGAVALSQGQTDAQGGHGARSRL